MSYTPPLVDFWTVKNSINERLQYINCKIYLHWKYIHGGSYFFFGILVSMNRKQPETEYPEMKMIKIIKASLFLLICSLDVLRITKQHLNTIKPGEEVNYLLIAKNSHQATFSTKFTEEYWFIISRGGLLPKAPTLIIPLVYYS